MRWVVICFFLLTSYGVVAQYYETYSPANGLVDARVTRIMQDGSGRIFFLTRDGLSIYDGQRIINHTRLTGLPVGMLSDGMMLPDGSLQLLSFNGDWVHASKNKIATDKSFLPKISEASSILSLPGTAKLIVSNKGLFINTNGLVNKISSIPPASATGPIDKVVASGNQIVFTYFQHKRNYIYTWDQTRNLVTDSLSIDPLINMQTDLQGRVQLCTNTGVYQLNTAAFGRGKLVIEQPWFHNFIPKNFPVQNIFFDKQGQIWFINDLLGCRQLDPVTGMIHIYSSANGLLQGVSSLFQDRENNFWFIAYGKGVQKLVQTNYEIINRIGSSTIQNVFASNTTDDKGLFLFTDKKMLLLQKEQVEVFEQNKSFYPDPVFFWQRNYWTYDSPDRLISNTNKKIILGDSSAVAGIAHYPSPNVNLDREGNLLLAGNLFTLVKKNGSSYRQPLPYFADVIVTDEKNDYWAFCRSNNIIRYSFRDNKLVTSVSLTHPAIEPRYAIHWNLDTFWIASRQNGILIAKITEQSFQIIARLTRENGLSNDFVETLLKVDHRSIAAGTASGLDIITLSGTDTLVDNVSSRINHFEPILQLNRGDNGMIYARTENLQLYKYNPFTTASTKYLPGAWFSGITVNNRLVDTAMKKFNYLQNNFVFSVSSPSFTDSRSIQFRFHLQGEKREWQQQNNKAEFSISNLAPGDYRLTVLIIYPGRSYPDKKLIYDFTIRPPFWKTWWFITAAGILLLLTAWWLARSYWEKQLQRQKMIMEKELAIEQERTKMARELHDGLGSMLSGVKHSFSAMKNQLDMDDTVEEKFHYNIGKLNDSIVELRNISHSMASESLLKYGLENSLKDYCQNISQSGELLISFEALSTADMLLKEEQSFHIFRIVQELLQNIIIHSGAKQAIIQLSYNQQRLYLAVEDDGRGFEWQDPQLKKGLGLKNIESRVKILKGRMDYRTAPSKGTSVLIEIPCEEKK